VPFSLNLYSLYSSSQEASKVQVTPAIQKLVSKPSEGNKEAPIRVGDTTPKTILVLFFLYSLFV
jgi:hypothetical protein